MRRSRWMKLFSEYGFKAKYHLGKANVVVESWSRKRVKPRISSGLTERDVEGLHFERCSVIGKKDKLEPSKEMFVAFANCCDQIREDLSYTEEPESILDRQDRVMRNKTIPFVKILWRNHPEREATWETEESIRTSYPHFLP
ncbi:putative reverse transcriptase domain-containing protein [Tanacetum coccineum]